MNRKLLGLFAVLGLLLGACACYAGTTTTQEDDKLPPEVLLGISTVCDTYASTGETLLATYGKELSEKSQAGVTNAIKELRQTATEIREQIPKDFVPTTAQLTDNVKNVAQATLLAQQDFLKAFAKELSADSRAALGKTIQAGKTALDKLVGK